MGAIVGSIGIGMTMAFKDYITNEVIILPGTTTTVSTFMVSSWTHLDTLQKSLPSIMSQNFIYSLIHKFSVAIFQYSCFIKKLRHLHKKMEEKFLVYKIFLKKIDFSNKF